MGDAEGFDKEESGSAEHGAERLEIFGTFLSVELDDVERAVGDMAFDRVRVRVHKDTDTLCFLRKV